MPPSPNSARGLRASAATLRTSKIWTGHRFTDLFTLLKIDGQWKIMNKVFHLHR